MKASCRDLGLMDYKACWDLQQSLFDELVAGKGAGAERRAASDEAGTILLVEHPPVYTLGKSGHTENLLVGREALEELGARFFHIDRGGDVTFHGPGQLVCYPILDLERLGIGLRAYIEALEEAVIRTVARYGIRAGRIAGASGVWVGTDDDGKKDDPASRALQDLREAERIPTAESETEPGNVSSGAVETEAGKTAVAATRPGEKAGRTGCKQEPPRKICAIGVRSSRYITMHGFALNVTTDLGWFSRINPCGFTDRGVTSIARETGREVAMDEVKTLVVEFLSEILNVRIYK